MIRRTGNRPSPVRRALAALGVRNLVLGIHDPAFPSRPDEDTGRGSPYSAGALDLLGFVAGLGFDGLQLGPQGLTSEANPSPYDGALFSRNPLSVALAPLTTPEWARLLPRQQLARIAAGRPGRAARVCHGYAHREMTRALDEAWRELRRRPAGDAAAEALRDRFRGFRRRAGLLERDALHAALVRERGADWPAWQSAGGGPLPEQRLFARDAEPGLRRLRATLRRRHAASIARDLFVQFVAQHQHREFRARASALGLRLWGDLQIGVSRIDAWTHCGLFLDGYRMGAPPSRTNPEGQPWGYPVLDPRRYGDARRPGDALRFVAARLRRCFADYDAVRIDHPHGLVCPWVYREDEPDAQRAVRDGARLFESPDLEDHPRLAGFALVRPDQLRRDRERHADDWVAELSQAQVRRYGVLLDAVLAAARRHSRGPADVACEVLSTCPLPLRRVLEHHGLGRFRVTQKLALDDPRDVYRSENARPEDWVLMGNHDTPPIWLAVERWRAAGTARRHAEYLAGRLFASAAGRPAWVETTAADPHALALAKLAELFVGPAQNVMIFFTDLFGFREPYNRPGTVDADNWSLRLGPDFRADYAARRRRGEALDLRRALALALRARGPGFAAAHATLLAELDGGG